MNAALAKIKFRLAHWREWELNPIVVKELRQAVRSWAVTGMLLLFLSVLFVASLGFLISQSFAVNANLELGASMFTTFMVILAGASVFFIPLYMGARISAERRENNPDLLYISTLSPARIIWGKFLCGAYIALLFFSACMPFMAFTNLLRGVDLPTVFFILTFLFLVVCTANLVAIFFGCVPASRPFKVLMALGGFFLSFWIVIPLVAASYAFMRSGIGTMMGGRDFWMRTLTAIGICLGVGGLFFTLSVALISPPSANRALPARLYLTVLWFLGGGLGIAWAAHTGLAWPVWLWADATFGLMMLALLVTISNSDLTSPRVRRSIPPPGIRRVFAFLFFNGAAGGLVWVGLILTATWLTARSTLVWFPKIASVSSTPQSWFAVTAAYAFCYALAGLLIHRKFLARRAPKLAGLMAILLAAAWALAPNIALFFLNQLSWKSVEGLQLGNLFNYFSLRDDSLRIYHDYFAFGWLLVMLGLSARWFWRQVRNFRPLGKIVPPPVLPEVPPVIPK